MSVQGCVSLSGSLIIDVSAMSSITEGQQSDVLAYNSSCDGGPVALSNVTVSGATSEKCKAVTAAQFTTARGLSVVFHVVDVPGCGVSPVNAEIVGPNMTAIIAGSVSGGVLFLVIVLFVLLYVFRKKIIPSYRMDQKMRKIRAPSS